MLSKSNAKESMKGLIRKFINISERKKGDGDSRDDRHRANGKRIRNLQSVCFNGVDGTAMHCQRSIRQMDNGETAAIALSSKGGGEREIVFAKCKK